MAELDVYSFEPQNIEQGILNVEGNKWVNPLSPLACWLVKISSGVGAFFAATR